MKPYRATFLPLDGEEGQDCLVRKVDITFLAKDLECAEKDAAGLCAFAFPKMGVDSVYQTMSSREIQTVKPL